MNEIATREKLSFLIIGGHAVNAYGYSRFTQDVDILVAQPHKSIWQTALESKGFGLYQDGGSFLQMTPPPDLEPLDLMVVNARTMDALTAGSKALEICGMSFQVPSLENLFALKLHVVAQGVPHRGYKDFMDILSLADINGVDLRSDKMRQLCDKFANQKIYERLLAFKA